jgi:hypothetical protein
MENQISIIINGIRYDAVDAGVQEHLCDGCDLFQTCELADSCEKVDRFKTYIQEIR